MNGMLGFHFKHHDGDHAKYARRVDDMAANLVRKDVTGFLGTVLTVRAEEYQRLGTLILNAR